MKSKHGTDMPRSRSRHGSRCASSLGPGIDARDSGGTLIGKEEVPTMAILRSLKRLLDDGQVHYEVHAHPRTFTARETAAADHVPPSEMAKVVVLRGHDRFLMAVMPASHVLDLERLRETVGDRELTLASE